MSGYIILVYNIYKNIYIKKNKIKIIVKNYIKIFSFITNLKVYFIKFNFKNIEEKKNY